MPLAEDLEEIVPGREFRENDLRTHYWIDGKGTLLFRHYPLRGAHVETFRFYQGSFAKDRKNCYCTNSKLTGADPETFRPVNYAYFKDHQFVWALGGKIKGADAESFVACDDGGLVTGGVRPPRSYGKDKARVYYYDMFGVPKPVRKADPEAFVSMNDNYFGKDAQTVFCSGRALPKANVGQWRVVGGFYSTDGSRMYYDNAEMKGADIDSLEVVTTRGPQLAKDKLRLYVNGLESSREEFEQLMRLLEVPPSTPWHE